MITCLKWSEHYEHKPFWAQWHRSSRFRAWSQTRRLFCWNWWDPEGVVENLDTAAGSVSATSRHLTISTSVELRLCTASAAAQTWTFRLDEMMIDNDFALSESRKVVRLVVVFFVFCFKKRVLLSKIRRNDLHLRICLSWSSLSFSWGWMLNFASGKAKFSGQEICQEFWHFCWIKKKKKSVCKVDIILSYYHLHVDLGKLWDRTLPLCSFRLFSIFLCICISLSMRLTYFHYCLLLFPCPSFYAQIKNLIKKYINSITIKRKICGGEKKNVKM